MSPRPMRRYRADSVARELPSWIGRYARAERGSPLVAHTIRTVTAYGWRTWCGVTIERPTDQFAPIGVVDCLGCRTRRDRS